MISLMEGKYQVGRDARGVLLFLRNGEHWQHAQTAYQFSNFVRALVDRIEELEAILLAVEEEN